jgi:plasmid stabilization system protein ParE
MQHERETQREEERESRLEISHAGTEEATTAGEHLASLSGELAEAKQAASSTAQDLRTAKDRLAANRAELEALPARKDEELARFEARIRAGEPAGTGVEDVDRAIAIANRSTPILEQLVREAATTAKAAHERVRELEESVDELQGQQRWGTWAAVVRPLVDGFARASRDSFALLTPQQRDLAVARVLHTLERELRAE